jgi:type I restriction enzyme R subunit
VLTQRPNYQSEAAWRNEAERPGYIQANKLRFLRPYQLKAIQALQRAVKEGKDRFLFEMATGTGKTLVAAAVIKLFLRSGNAKRVLFLVDRLELEDQAGKKPTSPLLLMSADFKTVIYKENRDDWRRAEIVVTTVQSLLFNNKYQKLFSPTDFDLVISDEAHRSIGGNARAVFDYFIGYKLGLTATPRDYLRRFDKTNPSTRDPREAERRLLLDTYRTFGCENSQPTFRYSLIDGVKEGYLINPTVVDARTEITTELLSEEGFVVSFTQRHMHPIILEVYGRFLVESSNIEEREYADPKQEIEVSLIHQSYISQKDIEICLAYDIEPLRTDANFPAIEALHQSLRETYAEPVGG